MLYNASVLCKICYATHCMTYPEMLCYIHQVIQHVSYDNNDNELKPIKDTDFCFFVTIHTLFNKLLCYVARPNLAAAPGRHPAVPLDRSCTDSHRLAGGRALAGARGTPGPSRRDGPNGRRPSLEETAVN